MNGMSVVRSLLRVALALACAAAGMATGADAQQRSTSESIQALLGDSTQYREAIAAFQKAVRAHDAAGVAALVSYPIKVSIGGSKRTIKAPRAFIAKYDSIVTPAIAAAVQDQKWDDLFVNYQGVMLGRGEVWFNGTCRDKDCEVTLVRIYTIQSTANLDPAPGSGN
jgi:hypothetical protein